MNDVDRIGDVVAAVREGAVAPPFAGVERRARVRRVRRVAAGSAVAVLAVAVGTTVAVPALRGAAPVVTPATAVPTTPAEPLPQPTKAPAVARGPERSCDYEQIPTSATKLASGRIGSTTWQAHAYDMGGTKTCIVYRTSDGKSRSADIVDTWGPFVVSHSSGSINGPTPDEPWQLSSGAARTDAATIAFEYEGQRYETRTVRLAWEPRCSFYLLVSPLPDEESPILRIQYDAAGRELSRERAD